MKIAILNDYLTAYGGAERVLDIILELYPDADIYTSQFWMEFFPENYKKRNIKKSFLKYLPKIHSLRSFYRKLSYFAFHSFDLSEYDLIIANTNGPSTWIRKNSNQKFIAYYHKIPGFNAQRKSFTDNWFANKNLQYSKQIDLVITNSFYSQKIFKKFLNKNSEVIYPAIDLEYAKSLLNDNFNLKKYIDCKEKEYFVFVGRLEEFKGLRYIIDAINKTNQKLIVIGEGPLRQELDKYENIKFLGFISDEVKFNLIAKSKALINGAVEQFGIVFIESLLFGTPVIAYDDGGAAELITKDFGVLFPEQNKQSVIDAINKFLVNEPNPRNNEEYSSFFEQFDMNVFKEKFTELVIDNI